MLAVAETKRAVAELGMTAIFLRPNIVNRRPWHSPYYDTLWATCQDMNIPVGFHEGTCLVVHGGEIERFRHVGTAHISTPPLEQMLACRDVIMGGVLERFPTLRVVFLEANCGRFPWWLGRMDAHFIWRRKYGELQHLRQLPSEYFRRQCFVSVECDEKFVRFVVEELGMTAWRPVPIIRMQTPSIRMSWTTSWPSTSRRQASRRSPGATPDGCTRCEGGLCMTAPRVHSMWRGGVSQPDGVPDAGCSNVTCRHCGEDNPCSHTNCTPVQQVSLLHRAL
jgi:hypothetical protein